MVEVTRQAGALVEFVEVTERMIAVGVEEAREKYWGCDLREAVTSIYMAMEYERLDHDRKPNGLLQKGGF
jgi:hypothetical protein